MRNLAVVDLGSNSVRLSVNQIRSDGTAREVQRCKEDCRLAENAGARHVLQPEAVTRALRALRKFRRIYSGYPQLSVIGIATAAVRQASNQRAFLARVKRATGINVRVLSGRQEARLDYVAVKDRVDAPRYLVMDVGGGSTEIILVNGSTVHPISLPVGAVSMAERFRLTDRITGENWFLAQNYFESWLRQLPWLNGVSQVPFILLGGAHRALARMDRHAKGFTDPNALDGYPMTFRRLSVIYRHLLVCNLAQRRAIPGLEVKRADVIVAGLLPLVTLMNRLDSDRILFSGSGVRQGLIRLMLTRKR